MIHNRASGNDRSLSRDKQGSGFGVRIMENQLGNSMENEMEPGLYRGL